MAGSASYVDLSIYSTHTGTRCWVRTLVAMLHAACAKAHYALLIASFGSFVSGTLGSRSRTYSTQECRISKTGLGKRTSNLGGGPCEKNPRIMLGSFGENGDKVKVRGKGVLSKGPFWMLH